MNSKMQNLFLAVLLGVGVHAAAQLKPIVTQPGTTPVFPSEVLVLDSHGLSPNHIQRPAGPFVLYIENRLRDHAETFTVSLDADGAADLTSVSTDDKKRAAPLLLNLEHGNYRVKLGKHPSLWLKLAITK